MSTDFDVVIIGAGPAGLTAAYQLGKAGKSVAIIERDPVYVGGISRTVSYNGFLFDIGGHRFFSKSKRVVALWNELLPNDFLDRPRLSRIYYDGRLFSYPLRAFEALGNLGVATSAACVASYAYARLFPVRTPRSLHHWVRNQFGEKLFSIFFRTYTEKVWGMSCDELSADWAAQRIRGLNLGTAILDATRRSLGLRCGSPARQGESGGVKTLINSFRYPRRGPGMMWAAAARNITAQGGRIFMGSSLERLVYDSHGQRWTVLTAGPAGSGMALRARHVISSAPIDELACALGPGLKSSERAQALRYRDFISVALLTRSESAKAFPDNWIYIHDPSVAVGRIQNFRSWSPEMVPEQHACLGMEYFCSKGDALWNLPDSDLIDLAKHEIGAIGLLRAADVLDAVVVRQPKAYPVYDASYQANVAQIREELNARYPNLHLVGRNGMHRYNNQDHAMMTAVLTAENIIAGHRRFDPWKVNDDAEYVEAGAAGADDRMVAGMA